MNDPTSAEFLQRLEQRDDLAAAELFDRYAQRLVALARKRISPALARRIDADDVVQSAYRSFFLHAREGEFAWNRAGDLWRLLVTITLRKLHRQAARHRAGKRSIDRESPADDDRTRHVAAAIDPEPQAVEVIALLEQFGVAMRLLSDDQRRAIGLRLQGESEVEIGKALSCSPRTVRRLLHQARERLEQELLRDDSPGTVRREVTQIVERDIRAPLAYDDFVLEAHLGSGGMGRVYRALQRSLQWPVAIKALRKSRLHDSRAVERFLQEGELLGRLKHKNIVGVQGIGRFPSGGYFLALDYIDGESLATKLRHGALPPRECLRIITEVAEAVCYSHEQGILHGDVTPGNVLLDRAGQVFVTDFGFAQMFSAGTDSASAATALGGTGGYLAPEQLSVDAPLDPRTDVFGLGAVCYAMLTGIPPLDANAKPSAEYYDRIAAPSQLVASLSAAIDRICLKALAFKAEDRFATAREFLNAIQTIEP